MAHTVVSRVNFFLISRDQRTKSAAGHSRGRQTRVRTGVRKSNWVGIRF